MSAPISILKNYPILIDSNRFIFVFNNIIHKYYVKRKRTTGKTGKKAPASSLK